MSVVGRIPIRIRLVLGSTVIAAVLFAGILVLVGVQVSTILASADVTLAQTDLAPFEDSIEADPAVTVVDPGTGILVYAQNPAGEVQVNTLPHDVIFALASRPAADTQFTMTDDEGRSFVVVGDKVSTSAGTWVLWSARSTSSSEIALRGLILVLVVAGLVLLVGFAVGSWVLAAAALGPVRQMRLKAEQLAAEASASGVLPVGAADDELRALAITLNDLLRSTRAVSEREKRMVSDAAHELRTPLAALKTQLELARADFGDAEALGRQVEAAGTSVDRLTSLASNLLELNRLENEHHAAISGTAVLVTELMGSVDRARMLALRLGGEVQFEAAGTEPQLNYALAPQDFGRLLDNLMANAVNASGTGGEVMVTFDQDAAGVTLEVSDNGPGMSAEFLPRAFDRFARPDASRTAATGGSGLGLAIARAIVVSAAGDINLRNAASGLVATVRIPAVTVQ